MSGLEGRKIMSTLETGNEREREREGGGGERERERQSERAAWHGRNTRQIGKTGTQMRRMGYTWEERDYFET